MNTYFNIQKILNEKTEGIKKFYLDKYKGHAEKFDAWVPAKDVKALRTQHKKSCIICS